MPLENANQHGLYAHSTGTAGPTVIREENVGMSVERLKVLEGRVDDILSRHAAVCAERDRLQGQLEEAQARIAEIHGQLETYEKERAQVRARVESILGRLEGLDLS
jgi:chromosome segregation ATPase